MRTCASVLLFAGLLCAQPASSTKPGSIEGVVLNSATDDPIKKANVTLERPGKNTNSATVSDSAGHFRFDNVEPDSYQVIALREGFSLGRVGSKTLIVAAEQHVNDVSIKLIPLAVVSGRVLDEDGDPLARAQVQALHYVYRRGEVRQLNAAGSGRTNDLGEYQILDLEPGQYYFLAAAQPPLAHVPLRTRGATPELTYPDTLYPSALHAEQATAFQLAPGTHLTNIDIRIRKVPAFHVRGKAVDSRTGRPVRNSMIRLQSLDSVFFDRFPIAQDGTFDARGVTSGPYILVCRTPEDLWAQLPLNVGDHDVDDVLLTLRPPLEISGTIEVGGAPPKQGSTIQVNFNPTTIGMSGQAQVNPDGSFALKVNPAIYQISIYCDCGAYLKSMHFGDQDVTSGRIDLTQQSGGVLKAVFGVDVGKLQGSVQNGNAEPANGALIAVFPEGAHQDREDLFRVSARDPDGKFNFPDLAPGDYKVFAWETTDTLVALSTELRKAFESRAVSVSISPGGKSSIDLKLIPAADIEAQKNKVP